MVTQSVAAALRALEAIAELQPVGLSLVARHLGASKATVQRALMTLAEGGWIAQVDDSSKRWTLTPKMLVIGSRSSGSHALRTVAIGTLGQLQQKTGETIHLTVPFERQMVLIERLDSAYQLRTFRELGPVGPMHASSNGKAYLAHLSPLQLDSYLAHGLEKRTPSTITDPQSLRDELAMIRERGYATNEEELDEGVVALGAALLDSRGNPVGAISVSAPASRLLPAGFDVVGNDVREAANLISAQLG